MTIDIHNHAESSSRRRTALPGVFRISLPNYRDGRGSFSPAWVREDFLAEGLDSELAQINLATNPTAGTLRGLHFQAAPFAEVKVVQVLSGAIFDVVVDLRPASPTFQRTIYVRLDAQTREALYLPKGVAHGYQTLLPDTTVLYTVSTRYAPDHERGVSWRDPALAIPWPLVPSVMSGRDLALPFLRELNELPDAEPLQMNLA